MLSKNVKNQIISNIEWDNEMQPIEEEEKIDFLNWFCENANEYNLSSNHEEEILENENIVESRCFGNSQYISDINGKEYAEGYILHHGNFICHGFNIVNNVVEDYTLIKALNGINMPSKYYGVVIPSNYIDSDEYNNFGNISILLDYWRDSN